MIRFNCHRCGMLMQAADTGSGHHAKCPGCGLIVVVPAANVGIVTPPPPPPVVVPPPVGPTQAAAMPIPPPGMPRPPGMPIPASGMPIPAVGMPIPPAGHPIPVGSMSASSSVDSLFDELLSDDSPTGHSSQGRLHSHLPVKEHSPHSHGAHQLTADDGKIGGTFSNVALRNLGFAAIGIGIISLGLFWIPFVGSAVALLGLATGAAAIFVSASRRDAPLGSPLAGAILSVVGLVLGGYRTYSMLNKTSEPPTALAAAKPNVPSPAVTGKSVESVTARNIRADTRDDRDPLKFASGAFQNVESTLAKTESAAGRPALAAKANSKPARTRLVYGGDDNAGGLAVAAKPAAAESTTSENETESAPSAVKWAAAKKKEPQGTGPLQVTVAKVVVGKVTTYPIGDLQTLFNVTSEPYLTVWLKIKNIERSGSFEFKGWMSAAAETEKIESKLIDDHGREHKLKRPFNKDEAIQKTTPPGPVFAGQTAADAVVFRVLPDDVDSMDLTLSGKAIGQDDDLHFRIPRSMITTDDSNPLLEPAGK